jgi:hypothetical protein
MEPRQGVVSSKQLDRWMKQCVGFRLKPAIEGRWYPNTPSPVYRENTTSAIAVGATYVPFVPPSRHLYKKIALHSFSQMSGAIAMSFGLFEADDQGRPSNKLLDLGTFAPTENLIQSNLNIELFPKLYFLGLISPSAFNVYGLSGAFFNNNISATEAVGVSQYNLGATAISEASFRPRGYKDSAAVVLPTTVNPATLSSIVAAPRLWLLA